MSGPATFPGVGVLYRATDEMPFLELARAADERGFTSLVLGEHTHIPVTSDPAQLPGRRATTSRDSYPRLLDPYVALSFVAAQTSLKIATCTSLPAQHDPIALAKALATLDSPVGRSPHARCRLRLEPRRARQPRTRVEATGGRSCRSTSS